MHILVIGSGGREHALSHALSHSPYCERLSIAPGNAGTGQLGENIELMVSDADSVIEYCRSEQVGLVVIGPEAPLEAGLADDLRGAGIPTVGPGKAGAILESSKDWSKQFMLRHAIPTARYRSFDRSELGSAIEYVQSHSLPIVVKASGLAAGKGVIICESQDEAVRAVEEMLSGGAFGEAGDTIVVEEFLHGIEVSVFVLTDGKDYVILPEAKDYKRIGEGDTGLNTGGMGAVSPVPFADATFMAKVRAQIVEPTLAGLRQENIDYKGFIFLGLMNVDGQPQVIEYNVRMGDPETEVVFPRISSDVADLFLAAANGELAGRQLQVRAETCCTVMLVSGGYPGQYEKDKVISGLPESPDVTVYHAGTKQIESDILTNGGRVLAVTALGEDLDTALTKAYAAAESIEFEGKYFRRDIGRDLME